MKFLLALASCVALLVAPQAPVQAKDGLAKGHKVVLVAAARSLDGMQVDLKALSKIAGAEAAAKGIYERISPYLEGLDRSKPAGMVLTTDGDTFSPLGFLPVKDLKKFLGAIEEFVGETSDAGNGVLEISEPWPVYIKEKNGYAFISDNLDVLKQTPADPAKLLDGLADEYLISIRAYIQNIPEKHRSMAVTQLRAGFERGLEGAAGRGGELNRMQQMATRMQLRQLIEMINETDQVTLGWAVDKKSKSTHIDLNWTGKAGSSIAKQAAAYKAAKSRFGGFVHKDAAVSLNVTGPIAETERRQMAALLQQVRTAMKKAIDEEGGRGGLGPADRRLAAQAMNNAMDVVTSTVRDGKVDMAASLLLEAGAEKTLTMVAAIQVADGPKLEDAVKKIVKLAEKDPDFPGVKINADKMGEVNFHTMTAPVDDEEARGILGEKVDVVLGVGPKAVYVSFGHDAMKHLKGAIKHSSGKPQAAPLAELKVSVGRVLKFAAAVEENPFLGMVAAMVSAKANANNDHLVLRASAIERGVRYRLSVEEGVIKGVGQFANFAAGGFGF